MNPSPPPLAGLRVLVTRPAAQAGPLLARLREAGAEPTLLPMLAVAEPRDPEAARQRLRTARGAHFWLFTSANAVRGAARLEPEGWPEHLIAIGRGTANALAALGHAALAPEGGSSESLLLWPELQQVEGLELLIVTGEGGRGLLAETLAERGALVRVARTYRREPQRHPPEALGAALADTGMLVITSGEALETLHAQAPAEAQARLRALPVVVPSTRVVELARRLGHHGPLLVPDAVSDAAYLDRLARWRTEPTT